MFVCVCDFLLFVLFAGVGCGRRLRVLDVSFFFFFPQPYVCCLIRPVGCVVWLVCCCNFGLPMAVLKIGSPHDDEPVGERMPSGCRWRY